MVSNLSEEFLPYYNEYLNRLWYSVNIENDILYFISENWIKINYSHNQFYEIILEIENNKKTLIKNLRQILKERGVDY